jgi:hypothetical protein
MVDCLSQFSWKDGSIPGMDLGTIEEVEKQDSESCPSDSEF